MIVLVLLLLSLLLWISTIIRLSLLLITLSLLRIITMCNYYGTVIVHYYVFIIRFSISNISMVVSVSCSMMLIIIVSMKCSIIITSIRIRISTISNVMMCVSTI